MKIFEIENKYFFAQTDLVLLLESYINPDEELTITFTPVVEEYNKKYYNGIVQNKQTKENILVISFSISNKNGELDVGVISTLSDKDNTKMVHTSLGSYIGGADMGYTAVKWIFRKIKEFALSTGVKIHVIKTSTRYTGARAKNNPGDDGKEMPKNFSTSQNITETLIYNCQEDSLKIVG